MTDFQLNLENEREGYVGKEDSPRSKPSITPTLVIGLGGTGTDTVRLLKRRLVWLWRRQEIEAEMEKVPRGMDPQVWYGEVWQRFEIEGGPPIIQVLAVDTWPWTNRAGQVYLNHHEYAYIGGYNANKVLHNLDNHPEIADWWRWGEDQIRPGQIHSGARQIRAIGRLSFYRRYREFWARVEPQIARITSIQARQDTENRGYQVAPSVATKRVYVISSLCGGTGAGAYLDIAARLRAYFEESAVITGIFVLPSAIIPELRSDLQKDRVRANAYAALKEIEYFQSHAYRLWLPGDDPVSVSPLFNRLYLVERENKAGEGLNSMKDICQLTANQVLLEGLTDVGSRVWEYDVNVTMERRERGGRLVAFNFSSFANSSLIVPHVQMLEYLDLTYARQLVTQGLLRELSPEDENQIGAEVQAALGRLRGMVVRSGAGSGEGPLDDEEYDEEAIEEGVPSHVQPGRSRIAPLEQLMQEVNGLAQRYGLRGAFHFTRRLGEEVGSRLQEAKRAVTRQKSDIEGIGQDLRRLRMSQPWYVRWNVWPLSLLTGAATRAHRQQVATLERRERELEGQLEELMARRDGWDRLDASIGPLAGPIEGRIQAIKRIEDSVIRLDMKRLFESRLLTDQPPYEMLTMVLGEKYIRERLTQEVASGGLNQRFGEDVRQLLQDPLVCQVRLEVSSVPEAGTGRYPTTLALAPCYAGKLENTLKQVAARAVHETTPPELFHVRRILETPDTGFQTRLRDLFTRCQPFWRYDLDAGGLSENDLEQVVLSGVAESDDRSWTYLLRDFPDFQVVETDDPTRIDACRIEHGLPIQYLGVLGQLKSKYDEFLSEHAGPMQLDARWEPGQDDALPDLIDVAPGPMDGEGPSSQDDRPASPQGPDAGAGADHDAGPTPPDSSETFW